MIRQQYPLLHSTPVREVVEITGETPLKPIAEAMLRKSDTIVASAFKIGQRPGLFCEQRS
jgi:hypothetical protein